MKSSDDIYEKNVSAPPSDCLQSTTLLIQDILKALRELRVNVVIEEFSLQTSIAEILQKNSFTFKKEYRLAPRTRIDFLLQGGLGIEVKKGRPNSKQVMRQLERYTAFEDIKAIILIVERNVNMPSMLNGKKCFIFGLNRLWGVALRS